MYFRNDQFHLKYYSGLLPLIAAQYDEQIESRCNKSFPKLHAVVCKHWHNWSISNNCEDTKSKVHSISWIEGQKWSKFLFHSEICHSKRDVVVVIDSSGSIRDNNPEDQSIDNWIILKGERYIDQDVDRWIRIEIDRPAVENFVHNLTIHWLALENVSLKIYR